MDLFAQALHQFVGLTNHINATSNYSEYSMSVVVLKDSEITGMGTHQELLESNQEYIELAKSQGILE